ncbi:DUF2188 domain-containing protein [Alteribacter natronophilus]|uniref:DUF2188 domain-containing protein n=1 Tax=Alteribacter natronophilus TaxID=2583810 RepID=UPI00110DB58F|nr:DUF2188 domain-containing protein [Alteribacter natronophilus]TMW70446.1 DUF2188 domain-containing protein [Alteribacter natronophilus]
MPWTKNDYPDSMKNLDKEVRDKAIEIANSLLEDGYEEGRAIPIAIDQAKEVGPESDVTYHITESDGTWEVKKEGAKQASDSYDTKQEAMDRGDELIESRNAKLVIHRMDGSVEKTKKATE